MSGRVVAAGDHLDVGVFALEALGQGIADRGLGIEQRDAGHAHGGQRRGDGATHTAVAHHQHPRALQLQPLALHAAHEAGAVEHVAHQASVGQSLHGIAGARHLHGGRDHVHQVDRHHLVGHGDERAPDVGELERGPQERGVVRRLATHGHHHRVDALPLEERVVDHRRLEGVGRVADVGDDFSETVDHGRHPGHSGRGGLAGVAAHQAFERDHVTVDTETHDDAGGRG
ncbi:hypothetical protein D9M68_708670 [compost metagenome]